jgi:hypothetical protein
MNRNERMRELRVQARALQKKLDQVFKELTALKEEKEKETYPCSCVKRNRDIEVFDMAEQERRKRVGLVAGGFVSESLSAREDCEVCCGSGIPTKHNNREQRDA